MSSRFRQSDESWLGYLRQSFLKFSADLVVAVSISMLVTMSSIVPALRETPLRVVLGFLFVLFVPGYVVTAVLFPRKRAEPTDESPARVASRYYGGISVLERVVLSLGLSAATVSIVGLLLTQIPQGFTSLSLILSIDLLIVASSIAAVLRRRRIPRSERFTISYRRWFRALGAQARIPDSALDVAVTGFLLLSLVTAGVSVGYAVTTPKESETFTRFYIVTESDGELVADNYPTNLTANRPELITVGVANQEFQPTNYSVVVRLQDIRTRDNDSTVIRSEELERLGLNLKHNETEQREVAITPTIRGDRLRLQFLLYRGSTPVEVSSENAYRETHLWVSVK